MRLAVIPARGGSKRIPGKNIKSFCGKPIIAWSIEAALASGCFDQVIVSTDSGEIAELARKYGAEVPFVRPPELSDDYAGTSEVVCHAIKWFQQQGLFPDPVCCIYATAPFVTGLELCQGLRALQETPCEYAFSATSFAFPIQRAFQITEQGRAQMFQPEYFSARSQDLPPAYHDAGQFYWGTAAAWLADKPLFAEHSVPVVLPRYKVLDIDTLEDWIQAELMFKTLQSMAQMPSP